METVSDRTWRCYNTGCRLNCEDCPTKTGINPHSNEATNARAQAGLLQPDDYKPKPVFTDEEFRECVRHLLVISREFDQEQGEQDRLMDAIVDMQQYLESKNYFNINLADLV